MEYQVTITEVLSRTERVEASSAVMAEKMVRLRYAKEDIVLDYSDFKSVDFHTSESPSLFAYEEECVGYDLPF